MLGFFTIQLVAIKQCLAYSFTEPSSLSWKNNSEKRPVEEGGSLPKSPLKISSELNTEELTLTPPAPLAQLSRFLSAPRVGKALPLEREISTFTALRPRGQGDNFSSFSRQCSPMKCRGKALPGDQGALPAACTRTCLQHRYLQGWCSPRGSESWHPLKGREETGLNSNE